MSYFIQVSLAKSKIKYVRTRHKTKFYNSTLADFRHCKVYVKPLVHLSYLRRQAERHAPHSLHNRTKFK